MDVLTAILVLGGAAGLTMLLSAVLGRLLPQFTSRHVKPVVQSKDHEDLPSLRLPNVGGMALVIVLWCLGGVWWVVWPQSGTILLLLIVLTTLFFALGFVDDWFKWRRGTGIGERTYLLGHAFMALVSVASLYWLVGGFAQTAIQGGRVLQALNVVGGLGLGLTLFWLFLLTFGSAFSVAVSDGIDGLTAGMASIAGGGMLLSLFVREASSELIAFGAALLGVCIGLLLFNQPSDWSSTGSVKRRARIYLGDSGAVALGGAFAALALFSGADAVWLFVGGVFLLDGGSGFMQAKVVTPFFPPLRPLAALRWNTALRAPYGISAAVYGHAAAPPLRDAWDRSVARRVALLVVQRLGGNQRHHSSGISTVSRRNGWERVAFLRGLNWRRNVDDGALSQ